MWENAVSTVSDLDLCCTREARAYVCGRKQGPAGERRELAVEYRMVTNGRGPGETEVFRGECKVHYVEEKIPVSHSLPNML